MAKRKDKKRSASGSTPSTEKTRGERNLPTFDENALSVLTARLEKGLAKETSQPSPSQNAGVRKPEKANARLGATVKDSRPMSKLKTLEVTRGVKRHANGDEKPASRAQPAKSPRGRETQTDERAILLEEILALGGTEEDLELVADAVSDEEYSNSKSGPMDKSLRKDLASFVSGLGIEGHLPEVEDDSTEDGQGHSEESDDAWEETSDLESAGALELEPERGESKQEVLEPTNSKDQTHGNPNSLIFPARSDWHAASLPDLPIPEVDESSRYSQTINNLKDYALSLLDADSALYTSRHMSSSSSHKFLSTIMSSGTLDDKISALTLVVQESPVHTTKSFESLLGLAKKRSRGQAVTALGALKDLLGVGVVLPSDRRLRFFASQPGLIGTLQDGSPSTWRSGQPLPGHITKAHLISWAYEDWLKEAYFDMLKVLEGWCSDEVEYARSRAVTYVYELLKEKPEQEANLLRLLVNKLGDPDKKIASRTSFLLLQLQNSHPLMKPVIIRSIETELLLRPGQSLHAKYYAINTLNQTILSGREEETAKALLGIYFELFVSLLKKPEPQKIIDGPVFNRKGQVQGGGGQVGKKAQMKAAKEEEAKAAGEETTEKMISAVLTGVNRAFPFSKSDDLTLEKHMDTLFRITHSSNFNTSIQALMLIEQLATSKSLAVDEILQNLHALYLNLLFRALRSDLNIKRVKAFAKRLLQVITLHQPPFICGAIFLIRELENTFPGLKTLFNDPESYDGANEEVFRDVPEDGQIITPSSPEVSAPTQYYDGRKRDPEHSNAEKSCLWEIIPFLVHFHPSVSLFADRLLNDVKMPPKPDLTSHSLMSFLDRFVYRNAKANAGGPRGGSIMQPLSGGDSRGSLLSNKSTQSGTEPLNTEAFWRKNVEDVAVDEAFFHKYFSQVGKSKQVSKKPPKNAGEGAELDEDQDEDEIWQALVDSRPEVEGPSDDDSDMEMLDLEDSDSEILDQGSDGAGTEVDVEGDEIEDFVGSEPMFSDSEDEEEGGAGLDDMFRDELEVGQGDSHGEEGPETSRQKKRRLKSLPTFASAEDYAAMLNNDDEDEGR